MGLKRPFRIVYSWDDAIIGQSGVTTHINPDEARLAVAGQIQTAQRTRRPFSWRLEERVHIGRNGTRTLHSGRINHAEDGRKLMAAVKGIPPWFEVNVTDDAGRYEIAVKLKHAEVDGEVHHEDGTVTDIEGKTVGPF
jgi:hypothetical protein